jgi:hypothetical protein
MVSWFVNDKFPNRSPDTLRLILQHMYNALLFFFDTIYNAILNRLDQVQLRTKAYK